MAERSNTVAKGFAYTGKQSDHHCIGPWELYRVHSTPYPLCHFVHTGLHHSVPLSVWRGWQHVSWFKGKLGQVLLVFGHGGPYASVLPVEEARAAVLQVFRIVHGGLLG